MSFKNEINTNINNYFNTLNDNDINTFADLIINTNKNIIFLSCGKSYNIALQFSDLLKCINISAIVLDISKILHGDIGFIKKNDLIIIISNSANTYELVNIIREIKYKEITSILLSSQKGILSNFCNYNFIVPVKTELTGCFNKIPSNSIISFNIYALQVLTKIIKLKKINKLTYIKNHTQGSIGKNYQPVKNFLIKKNKCYITEHTTLLYEAILNMNTYKIACCVIKNNEKICGFLSDRDIRMYIEKHKQEALYTELSNIMNKNYFFLDNENILVKDITEKYKYIPVIKNNQLLGIFEN